MDAAPFYEEVAPDAAFSQGDVFLDVPHVILKDRPKTPPPLSLAGKKAGFLTDELAGPTPTQAGAEIVLPAPCLFERAILLTYGCEIDKDQLHRMVALIRPMSRLQAEQQEVIRKGGKYACLHLPPFADRVQEGYVDFHRISTVSPEWLKKAKRVATLAEQARRKLLLRLFLYLSRLQLEEAIFDTTLTNEE